MTILTKSQPALRGKSTPRGTDAADPCVDCATTRGYVGPKSLRPVRIKGRCMRCHDLSRKPMGQRHAPGPKPAPDREYHPPTPLLRARYEAMTDLRTHEAVELADEIACRLDESKVKRLESERYVYLPDKNMGFTRSNRRYFGKFPPVRASRQSAATDNYSLFVVGEVA